MSTRQGAGINKRRANKNYNEGRAQQTPKKNMELKHVQKQPRKPCKQNKCILHRAADHRRKVDSGYIPPAIQKIFLDVSNFNQMVENIKK